MVELTAFESNLIRLDWIWIRLNPIVNAFPTIKEHDNNERTFGTVMRELVILYLCNFFSVREDLIKDNDFRKLDNRLSIFIKEVISYKEPFKKIRNNYVAHIQDGHHVTPFQITLHEIIDEYQLPTALDHSISLAETVRIYCEFVLVNFKDQYNTAARKQKSMDPSPLIWGSVDKTHYTSKLQSRLKQITRDLSSKGYSVPNIQSQYLGL